MHIGDVAQKLADIQVSSVFWYVVILTVARVAFVKLHSPALRPLVEIIEAGLIVVVLLFLVIQPFVAKFFYIPSASMTPTLVEDDHILVNRLEYHLESPHHGDIIVFAAPPQALQTGGEEPESDGEPTDYIKRLIGLPGDTIQVVRGYLQIGDREYTHADLDLTLGLTDPTHERVVFDNDDMRVYAGGHWQVYDRVQIAKMLVGTPGAVALHPGYVLRNGVRLVEPYIAEDPDYNLKVVDGHSIRYNPEIDSTVLVDGEEASPADAVRYLNAPPGKVPAGDVLVLGDNRNDSNDSSEWGPLDERRIIGKTCLIFYPLSRIRFVH